MHTFTSCECVDIFHDKGYNYIVNTSLIKSCSFFGHRQVEGIGDLESKIERVVEQLIKSGCEIFYFGGYGDFDELCYKVVTKMQEQYRHIKRVFCLTDEKYLSSYKRPKWMSLYACEEYVYFYLKYDYWYTKIYFRNCEIVKRSDLIVFYAREDENSGAYKILKYATKNKKQFINLMEK